MKNGPLGNEMKDEAAVLTLERVSKQVNTAVLGLSRGGHEMKCTAFPWSV